MRTGGTLLLGDHAGALLTAGLTGSFGTLDYALLALGHSEASGPSGDPRRSITADLMRRGFRPACNGDYADIALKAQTADGSIVCRATTSRISLVVDDRLVWTRRIETDDDGDARWIQAARTRDVTLISGDHLLVSAAGIDSAAAAATRTLVMAKIPTEWLQHSVAAAGGPANDGHRIGANFLRPFRR